MVDLNKLSKAVGTIYKYLGKAVQARERFYQGMDEAAEQALSEKHPNMGPEEAKIRFGESLVGKQLVADNRWHMLQAQTFGSAATASGVLQLVYEQQQTNRLLAHINDNLVKLVVSNNNLDRILEDIHGCVKEMQVH